MGVGILVKRGVEGSGRFVDGWMRCERRSKVEGGRWCGRAHHCLLQRGFLVTRSPSPSSLPPTLPSIQLHSPPSSQTKSYPPTLLVLTHHISNDDRAVNLQYPNLRSFRPHPRLGNFAGIRLPRQDFKNRNRQRKKIEQPSVLPSCGVCIGDLSAQTQPQR